MQGPRTRSARSWMAVIALSLMIGACGGDDGLGDAAASAPSDGAAPSVDPATLDYEAALLGRDDLEGMLPADWKRGDEGGQEGVALRSQCGQDAPGPPAIDGALLEHLDADTTISVTTSVHAFADQEEARGAFDALRAIAEGCTAYSVGGDEFERISAPLLQDAGEDSFSLWVEKPDTGLVVADVFVIQRQFVFDVRFAIAANSPIHPGIAATIADEAARMFVSWAEDQG